MVLEQCLSWAQGHVVLEMGWPVIRVVKEEEEDSGGLVSKRAHSGSIMSNGCNVLNICMRNYEDNLWSATWSWIPETSVTLSVHELFF